MIHDGSVYAILPTLGFLAQMLWQYQELMKVLRHSRAMLII